jgi:hypothetical protein
MGKAGRGSPLQNPLFDLGKEAALASSERIGRPEEVLNLQSSIENHQLKGSTPAAPP